MEPKAKFFSLSENFPIQKFENIFNMIYLNIIFILFLQLTELVSNCCYTVFKYLKHTSFLS